jgi:hypothetical protein
MNNIKINLWIKLSKYLKVREAKEKAIIEELTKYCNERFGVELIKIKSVSLLHECDKCSLMEECSAAFNCIGFKPK